MDIYTWEFDLWLLKKQMIGHEFTWIIWFERYFESLMCSQDINDLLAVKVILFTSVFFPGIQMGFNVFNEFQPEKKH